MMFPRLTKVLCTTLQGLQLHALLSVLPCGAGTATGGPGVEVPNFRPYHLMNSQEIHSTLQEWQQTYPQLLQVQTAQDMFGLATAGDADDCPFDKGVDGCLNYIAVVEDQVAHPVGTTSNKQLPTMLLSGELHGNERVGPTVVMETLRLLLEAATCESLPTRTSNQTLWELEAAQAVACRTTLLNAYGMTEVQRQWLARLVATRRIVVVPTANALGYFQNLRTEAGYDPNRDFPYDQLDPRDCMQTIAGRTMNEVFRHYAITNSFTFHGGTELLGYEWGNPSHYTKVSPDDIAQDELAAAFVAYGGGFEGSNGQDHPPYLYGDMNSIIYYVRGGFEDYAYAGSWDHEHMLYCEPDSYGGYPRSKTEYDDGMLRSFNMLVETSWVKIPNDNDLGTTANVLVGNSAMDNKYMYGRGAQARSGNNIGIVDNSDRRGDESRDDFQEDEKEGQHRNLRTGNYYAVNTPALSAEERLPNGHVARNIRLSMAAIDLIQPYVRIFQMENIRLTDDVVPMVPPSSSSSDSMSCLQRQQILTAPRDTSLNVDLKWTAGGGMTIDNTQLWVATVDASDLAVSATATSSSWLDNMLCSQAHAPLQAQDRRFLPVDSSQQAGTGAFSKSGSFPTVEMEDPILGPVFSSTLNFADVPINSTTSYIVVVASATMDAAWTGLPTDAEVGPSGFGPQSHMVQSRTNADWNYVNPEGYIIQGQDTFYSSPLIIEITDGADAAGTFELLNNRWAGPAAGSSTVGDNVVVERIGAQSTQAGKEEEEVPVDFADDGNLRRLRTSTGKLQRMALDSEHGQQSEGLLESYAKRRENKLQGRPLIPRP